MSNKSFYIVLGLAILVGGYLFLRSRRASASEGSPGGARKIGTIFGLKEQATNPAAKAVVSAIMGADVIRKYG